ncbi:MAG: hypothetical protein D6702_06585 [Planctomycetota bacterium]|nr:MAG: hypothetical protein D6702_06585 [Planctomycetota bacterium]
MAEPGLEFGPGSSFDADERRTLTALHAELLASDHPKTPELVRALVATLKRVARVGTAVHAYPPIFSELDLGGRHRDADSLVDLLGRVEEASADLYLPTRAVVGRVLVIAELNAWRLASYLHAEVHPAGAGGEDPVGAEIDHWLHGCVYSLLAEDVLRSLAMDRELARPVREKAVSGLCAMWESRHTYGARHFFPLLAATWAARRRIRVSVGTLLGVSEIFRLLQAGGDPEFVRFFCREQVASDEAEAFQEFLIGVPTERIRSLAELLEKEGGGVLGPAEAGLPTPGRDENGVHECVRFYEFFRDRHLAALARRIKDLPGPKKTAEEYVMIHYLEESDGGGGRD